MTATATRDSDTDSDKKGKGGKGEKGEKKKKGLLKSKKFIIILVVVLGGGGFAAKKFLIPPGPVPKPTAGDAVIIDPNTVNLRGGHYLQIGMTIELVSGAASATTFQISQAEQLTIDEFSNRTVASLGANGARQKLMKDLEKKIQKAYPKEVYSVYLTKFVTQ